MDTDTAESNVSRAGPVKDEKASVSQVKPHKKRTAKSYALHFLVKISVTALVLAVIFRFIAGIHICHTNCAYPTIRDGEFCLTYRLADLKQGTRKAKPC